MVDLTKFKEEINLIKKIEKNDEIKNLIELKDFNYINYTENQDVNNFLNEKSYILLNFVRKSNIFLGNIFLEVQDYLTSNSEEEMTYIKWLESNGFNRMTALRYKKRAELYNSLKSSKAKYFIGITSQRIIDEILKFEDKEEILHYLENLEEMKDFDNIKNFLKKDIILEIEEKTEKENIKIKERIKKLPLKKIERLDTEKKNQVNELVQKIEEILEEQK